jgi:broad specificity polyphosphatase/5'/3'-nucleotidase SurE
MTTGFIPTALRLWKTASRTLVKSIRSHPTGDNLGFAHDDGTDCMAVHEGYISVTPLQVDLTNYKLLQESYVPNFNWP